MTTSNNTTKRNTIFTVEFIKKTITGTKTAFNKAGHILEPEYAELAALVSRHPDFTLVIKEPKKRTTKKKESYKGLDYDMMEKYLGIMENSKSLLSEYESVKRMAKSKGISVYPVTKKWFLNKFEDFKMSEAKKAITQHCVDAAENNDECTAA